MRWLKRHIRKLKYKFQTASKEAQLPVPEFRNISEGFMVTVFADKSKVGEKVGEILTENTE